MFYLTQSKWWLVTASFFTSTFTAVFGVGGGVLLLSFMTVSHVLKLLAFGSLGFAFSDYLNLILMMSVTMTMGSFAGTHIRKYVPNVSFKRIFRWLITALALRMIYLALGGQIL